MRSRADAPFPPPGADRAAAFADGGDPWVMAAYIVHDYVERVPAPRVPILRLGEYAHLEPNVLEILKTRAKLELVPRMLAPWYGVGGGARFDEGKRAAYERVRAMYPGMLPDSFTVWWDLHDGHPDRVREALVVADVEDSFGVVIPADLRQHYAEMREQLGASVTGVVYMAAIKQAELDIEEEGMERDVQAFRTAFAEGILRRDIQTPPSYLGVRPLSGVTERLLHASALVVAYCAYPLDDDALPRPGQEVTLANLVARLDTLRARAEQSAIKKSGAMVFTTPWVLVLMMSVERARALQPLQLVGPYLPTVYVQPDDGVLQRRNTHAMMDRYSGDTGPAREIATIRGDVIALDYEERNPMRNVVKVDGTVEIDYNALTRIPLVFASLRYVTNDVRVKGGGDETRTRDLFQLPVLETVGGTLSVSGMRVRTLTGLSSVRSVSTLRLAHMPHVESLGALKALTHVNHLDMWNMRLMSDTLPPRVTRMAGIRFETLPSVQQMVIPADLAGQLTKLFLRDLSNIERIDGASMAQVVQKVFVDRCPRLATLDIMRGVEEITEIYTIEAQLDIPDAPRLVRCEAIELAQITSADMRALSALAVVTRHMVINNANNLRSLSGLERLRVTDGGFSVWGARALEDISAIRRSGANDNFPIRITNTPRLKFVPSGGLVTTSHAYLSLAK